MIHREVHDRITVLRMEHGKANAIDPELLAELGAAFDMAVAERTGAIVLTGTGNMFSAGVNLFKVIEGGAAYLDNFLPALSGAIERLLLSPLPVIAAVNGHALAGGCVIAAACDLRVMADGGGKIGVTELRVGVPFPAMALEAFLAAVPGPRGEELLYRGVVLSPAEAVACGLVHRLAPPDDLMGVARRLAAELAAIPPATFALTKRQLRAHLMARVARHDDGEVRRLWADPEVQATLRRFVEQNVGRK